MSGNLIYKIENGHRLMSLRLTVCDEEDLKYSNLAELRRRRIMRLLSEAKEQGYLLGYKDLNIILLASLATLKRDINYLKKQGVEVFIRNGKNGNSKEMHLSGQESGLGKICAGEIG